MDSYDSEDSDGSSIVIGPISYSQYQEHTRSGTNLKHRYILQSSDISSSECDAQKEATISPERKRSKRGKSKRSTKRSVVPTAKTTAPSATVSVPKKSAPKKTSRKSKGKNAPSMVSQETPSTSRAVESVMTPLSSAVPVTTPSSSVLVARDQMLTGPDHEAELEEVTRMPEETPRSRDLQGLSHFIQISIV